MLITAFATLLLASCIMKLAKEWLLLAHKAIKMATHAHACCWRLSIFLFAAAAAAAVLHHYFPSIHSSHPLHCKFINISDNRECCAAREGEKQWMRREREKKNIKKFKNNGIFAEAEKEITTIEREKWIMECSLRDHNLRRNSSYAFVAVVARYVVFEIFPAQFHAKKAAIHLAKELSYTCMTTMSDGICSLH